MKAIEQHIDNMFQDLPATQEIQRIKNDLYLNAVDRYEELISLGKTESEALGTIIIEMGEREILLEELGYNQEEDLKDYSLNTLEDAQYYIDENRRGSNKIGLGVLMILVGAASVSTFNTFNYGEIGVMLLFVLIALSVGLFITSGLRLESLAKQLSDEDEMFYMVESDYEIIEEEFMAFEERERYRIPLGVMIIILAILPIIYFSFIDNEFLIERYGVLMLMTAIGIGVFQFIKYGMIHSAYEKVLNVGEYSESERRFQQKVEPIAGIYWIAITLIYLTWSFWTFGWHYTWVIWPIAGFLWAIVMIIIKMREDQSTR